MNIAIAIFVKTPGVSPLKTRLAATTGKQKAEHFYQLSLKCIVNTLKQIEIKPYWAIAEKQSLNHPLWSDFSRMYTGEGDLGGRQSQVYHELLKTHDGVMLIGGDAPQLSTEIIKSAMKELQSNDYAIGPANDGGYYLLAGRKAIAKEVWNKTPWSDSKTRETLISLLDAKPVMLDALSDVDTEADLHQMLKEMPSEMNQDQLVLKDWINQL